MLPTQPVRAVFQEMQQKWDHSGLDLILCAPYPQMGTTQLCTQIAVLSTADQWQLVKRQDICGNFFTHKELLLAAVSFAYIHLM